MESTNNVSGAGKRRGLGLANLADWQIHGLAAMTGTNGASRMAYRDGGFGGGDQVGLNLCQQRLSCQGLDLADKEAAFPGLSISPPFSLCSRFPRVVDASRTVAQLKLTFRFAANSIQIRLFMVVQWLGSGCDRLQGLMRWQQERNNH